MKLFVLPFLFLGLSLSLTAQQATVNISQDPEIDALLDYKKDVKTQKTYKIQVFQSVDPDAAQASRSKFLTSYGQWPVEIKWFTPNYKVWVGNFSTRLEADRALAKIKKKYMYANILQPKEDK